MVQDFSKHQKAILEMKTKDSSSTPNEGKDNNYLVKKDFSMSIHEKKDEPPKKSIIKAIRDGDSYNPSDIRKLMGDEDKCDRKISVMEISECGRDGYVVTNLSRGDPRGSLVDRGANGGLSGAYIRVINKTYKSVDITGIDKNCMQGLPIITSGGLLCKIKALSS